MAEKKDREAIKEVLAEINRRLIDINGDIISADSLIEELLEDSDDPKKRRYATGGDI